MEWWVALLTGVAGAGVGATVTYWTTIRAAFSNTGAATAAGGAAAAAAAATAAEGEGGAAQGTNVQEDSIEMVVRV